MKKFECKGCELHCILTPKETCLLPKFCPFSEGGEIVWHEVKEKVGEVECVAKTLPGWCKVERHGFDNEQKRYFEIVYIDTKWVGIEYLDNGTVAALTHADIQNCSKATKRPFNEKEMRELVGKVIAYGEDEFFVSAYFGKEKCLTAGIFCEFDAQSLMRCFCEGKPCYKLEHFENGRWVQ